jgi:hypothetical protein
VSLFSAIVAHERLFRTFVMGSTLTFTVRLTFNETAAWANHVAFLCAHGHRIASDRLFDGASRRPVADLS